MPIARLRKTARASFPAYSGARQGTVLEVGSGKAYATLAAAMTYLGTQTWASSAALVGTVSVTAGSAAVTGTGFSALSANDYLLVGANWWAIKSIESNTALTLWAGAQATVSGAAATRYVLNKFTVELFDSFTLATSAIPNGLDILIIGNKSNVKITVTTETLTSNLNDKHRVEIANLTVDTSTATAGLIFGGHSGGRSIFYIHDVYSSASASTGSFTSGLYGAAVTISDLHGFEARFNLGGDYISLNSHHITTNSVSDHFLIAQNVSTDAGHPITINEHISISRNAAVVAGQSAGFEFNALPASKVINITNSTLIAYHTTTPLGNNAAAQVLWTPTVGTVNLTDCILDCLNNTTDIYSRGATINLTRTTRLSGGACRSVVPI